jgi:hypothetical protein
MDKIAKLVVAFSVLLVSISGSYFLIIYRPNEKRNSEIILNECLKRAAMSAHNDYGFINENWRRTNEELAKINSLTQNLKNPDYSWAEKIKEKNIAECYQRFQLSLATLPVWANSDDAIRDKYPKGDPVSDLFK